IVIVFLLLEKENITFGFCNASKKLVDISALLRAAKAHSFPGLGVCMQLEELMENLTLIYGDTIAGESSDKVPVPDEFMNCKKAHEVQAMSEVVASLAESCRVKQVRTFIMFSVSTLPAPTHMELRRGTGN
ncbi:hypothetical protein PO909_028826, partial [Leuciscus waleckii]